MNAEDPKLVGEPGPESPSPAGPPQDSPAVLGVRSLRSFGAGLVMLLVTWVLHRWFTADPDAPC